MNSSYLEKYKISELKEFASDMNIEIGKCTKTELIEKLLIPLKEYEEYKIRREDRYERLEQLGKAGKEGVTYLVRDKNGDEYAMKTFKKNKSSDGIILESELQHKASKMGIAPIIYDVDTVFNYIVMERLDMHLFDVMKKQNGELTKAQQNDVIRLFKKLDDCGIFHNDSNIMNYMYKISGDSKKLYLIDYGLSKEINEKLVTKLNTSKPNIKIMLLGFVLKLKEMKCNQTAYKYLLPYISDDDKLKFNL